MFRGYHITHNGKRISLTDEEVSLLTQGMTVETILNNRKNRKFKSAFNNLFFRIELAKLQGQNEQK